MDISTSSWHSYPSVYALGHKATALIRSAVLNIEEKIDGSQFSFMKAEDGTLRYRSRKEEVYDGAPGMFDIAIASVKERASELEPSWTYRGEFLAKPKHNTWCYERIPVGNIIIFDINTGHEEYLGYEDKAREALRIGLECVPLLIEGLAGEDLSLEVLNDLLTRESILGGVTIEGVVLKPWGYSLFGADKKALMAKYVSEKFKERNQKMFRRDGQTKDVIERIIEALRTEARWNKAVQHLAEDGKLQRAVQDIGPLINAVSEDVQKEDADWIKDMLYKEAIRAILRGTTQGLPEWYKEKLARELLEEKQS